MKVELFFSCVASLDCGVLQIDRSEGVLKHVCVWIEIEKRSVGYLRYLPAGFPCVNLSFFFADAASTSQQRTSIVRSGDRLHSSMPYPSSPSASYWN